MFDLRVLKTEISVSKVSIKIKAGARRGEHLDIVTINRLGR
jgi:hypothetical protein